jgi:C-terminal processing protease CtpA/Prc
MKKRTLWLLSICLVAMSITLAALPGFSQKALSTDDAAVAQLQTKLQELQSSMQQASAAFSVQRELQAKLQDLQQVESSENDADVEVFTDSGSWLGVETHEVTAENVKTLKLPAERGALVGKIIPDSPAAKAGLKENDVITEVNGQRVEGTAQFRRMIREIPAGRAAQFTVLRDSHSQTINVTLGSTRSNELSHTLVHPGSPGSFLVQVPDLPDMENMEELKIFTNPGMSGPRIGVEAEDLRGALGNYFGAPDGEGILVRNVFNGTPAEKAGLKAGDVITSIDGKRVRSISDLRAQLKASKSEGKTVKIGLLRNKAEMILDLNFPVVPKNEIQTRGQRTNL